MSKIERYAGNLRAFGSNAQGLERTLFGETTQADDLTSQVTASFLRGWGIVGPSENPSLEDFNAAMYAMSQFIAYQHQMGIPEWDVAQEYYKGSICVRGGETYSSLVDDNIGSAPPSAKWTQLLSAKNGLSEIATAGTDPQARGHLGFDAMGIGLSTVATQPSLDWQQFDFVTAGNYLVIFSNMTNVPAGVSYTTGTYLWVRTLGANGQSITIEVIPATSVDSNFKIYEVLINGAKGARTFSVRQAFTSANTIPFANLAVGTAAKLAAAVAVQGVSGYLIIPALVGGVEKNTIIQWGAFAGVSTGDTPVTFPFPFPNAVRHVYPCAQALGTGAYAGYNTPTKTGFNGNMWSSSNTRQPGNSSYLAIGE